MRQHADIKSSELFKLIKNKHVRLAGNIRLKIYGTLNCTFGRKMKKANRVFFENAREAIHYGFRPCASCLYLDYSKWKSNNQRSSNIKKNYKVSIDNNLNYQRIEQAIKYLEENFHRQPELDEVAEKVHLSPFHFQRIFTDWAGISPKRFLQFLTINYLKDKLKQSKNIMEVADAVGLSSQSRVYDLFTTLEAVTPQEYKLNGRGIQIDYGFHDTPFGLSLIGITARGICWLSFIQSDEDPKFELEKMKEHWYHSLFYQNQSLTQQVVFNIFSNQTEKSKLHLFAKGTNFQVKVWNALLKIPIGNITTYQDVAKHIENAKAVQAVGSAIGSNHIAYLIPCHRVIRKDGVLGEYRWSSPRKKGIIGWEMARVDSDKS